VASALNFQNPLGAAIAFFTAMQFSANLSTARGVLIKTRKMRLTVNKNKYRNTRVSYDGRQFDSKRECEVYKRFAAALKGGAISELECQKRYRILVEGMHVCTYVADFWVKYPNGEVEVWDAKGFKTKEYLLKKKLMKAVYDINVREC